MVNPLQNHSFFRRHIGGVLVIYAALGSSQASAYLADVHNNFQLHNVSAAPVYTWTAAATGTVPTANVNNTLRPSFQVTYDLSPIENGVRLLPGAGPFEARQTFLLVNAETGPDTIVKATVATTTIPAANPAATQTFTYNPNWGTTTLGNELAASGNDTAEYRIERRRFFLNDNSDIVTLSVNNAPGAVLTGGAASPQRTNSAGIVYNANGGAQAAANTAPVGADIPAVAVSFGAPLEIFALSSGEDHQVLIKGFNDTGYTLQLASSGAQERVQPISTSDDSTIQFASSVTFNDVWLAGSPSVGEFDSSSGVWAAFNGTNPSIPYSAFTTSGRPAILPGDGEVVSFESSYTAGNALWLFFNPPSSSSSGEPIGFLITAIPEPSTVTLFTAGLLIIFGYSWRRKQMA